ncbi:MAG: hypothetical protein Q4G54_12025 [Pelistega sp.]|nr:hypothetical protein [Pelistega sp.]
MKTLKKASPIMPPIAPKERQQGTLSKNGKRLLMQAIDDFEQGRSTRYESVEALIKAVK